MTTHPVRTLAAFACCTLLSIPALAQTSPDFALHDQAFLRRAEGPRLSVYWQIPFEAARWSAASYGLRIASAPLRHSMVDRLPLFDLRAQHHRTTLTLSGVPAFRVGEGGPADSFDSLDWRSPVPYLLGVAAAAGIACATHHWPCRKSESGSGYTAPPTGGGLPTTGGG